MPPRYLQEFRAQYPGAYDDVPDRNLARALIKKDPIRWTPLVGDLVMAQQQPPGPGTTNLTTTDVLRGVGKGADFGLPLIGAMGGGAVGMPMGPGGAMLGGGLGGALGQQGANVVNQLISGIDPAAAAHPYFLGLRDFKALLGHELELPGELPGQPQVVGIKERDHLGGSGRDPRVPGGRDAPVLPAQQPKTRVV